MKSAVQFVALAVVMMLAIHPLIADIPCAQRSSLSEDGVAACCSMATSIAGHQMRVDSHVSEGSRSIESCCNPSYCRLNFARTILQMAILPNSTPSRVAFFATIARLSTVHSPALAGWPSGNAVAPAQARAILDQAFRI